MPGRRLLFGAIPASPPFNSPKHKANNLSTTTLSSKPAPASNDIKRASIAMDHLLHLANAKRKSMTGPPSPKLGAHKPSNRPKSGVHKSTNLDIDVKSPPLVFHGNPENSSGALLGGELNLIVNDEKLELAKFTLELKATVTTKKPVSKDCPACANKVDEIFKWNFIHAPTSYSRAKHTVPFSHLLPGHLTATTNSRLGTVSYSLIATVTKLSGEVIQESKALDVKRALQPPQNPRSSQRIFPPTTLRTVLTHPPVLHPIGSFDCHFKLSGISSTNETTKVHQRWTLRRLTWRIEEHNKMISPACAKHANKVGGEGKGVLHTHVRTIGESDVKDGWKYDWAKTGSDGTSAIELEFAASIRTNASPSCDIEVPTGLAVTHKLCVELIVTEEHASYSSPERFQATGTARVLRTQHNVALTDRAGLGVSWDEETPPVYEDVPDSPPGYKKLEQGPWEHLEREFSSLGASVVERDNPIPLSPREEGQRNRIDRERERHEDQARESASRRASTHQAEGLEWTEADRQAHRHRGLAGVFEDLDLHHSTSHYDEITGDVDESDDVGVGEQA